MKTVSDFIFCELEKLNIKHVFLVPGGGAMHLNDALERNQNIEPIVCQHEQACGISAEAYGRIGEKDDPKFGVALVTSGPGSTNVITPVAGAWIDSIPMLIISGQAKTDDLNPGNLRQGGVQEVNIIELVKSITKYSVQIDDANSISYHLEKAINIMLKGRQGPVWIDIPLDIQAKKISTKRDFQLYKKTKIEYSLSPIELIIKNAQRPLILAGHGARLSGSSKVFEEWVEKHRVPVITTWNALDLLAHDNELNIGRPGVVANRAANIVIQNSDLIIVLGARLDNVVTAYKLEDFGRLAKKIIVDIDNEELLEKENLKNFYLVNDDIKDFLIRFFDCPFSSMDPGWNRHCIKLKDRFINEVNYSGLSKKNTISHGEFVDSISTLIPSHSLISTGSSGLAIEFFYARFRNKECQRVFLTSGLGAMGYGVSQSIGISLAKEKKQVFLFESDGSIMMNIQELATVKAYALPIKIFIMNNGGYASIKNTQTNYFNKRFVGVDEKSGLNIPSFKKIAYSFDIKYHRVEKIDDLKKSWDIERACENPVIFDIALNNTDILEPKCQAIIHEDGSITSMPLEDLSPLLKLSELQKLLVGDVSDASIKARNKKDEPL